MMDTATGFERYFTLEEAAGLLPEVKREIEKARREVSEMRDGIILFKRILDNRARAGEKPTEEEGELLQQKLRDYEAALHHWMQNFAARGIILRDLDAGLIDFPYRSAKTGLEYFLCWRWEEEGIFYFHPVNEGFPGRRPITLLPD